jgi:hypothetical protein
MKPKRKGRRTQRRPNLKEQSTAHDLPRSEIAGNGKARLVIHQDGTLSVGIDGHWRHQVAQITRAEYGRLSYDDHERIIAEEFRTGRPLIEGCAVIVARPFAGEQFPGAVNFPEPPRIMKADSDGNGLLAFF